MIRISNCEDRESSSERTITITGTAESVALAQYLINTRSVDFILIYLSLYPLKENKTRMSCPFMISLAILFIYF